MLVCVFFSIKTSSSSSSYTAIIVLTRVRYDEKLFDKHFNFTFSTWHVCVIAGTDEAEDDLEQRSGVREFQQDGQISQGKQLSSKTIKAILELICDEAVSIYTQNPQVGWGTGPRPRWERFSS